MPFFQFSRRLLKFFLLIFLFSFLIFNLEKVILIWDKIIFYTNYKFISREISLFFEKIFPFEKSLKEIELKRKEEDKKETIEIKKENLIEIPKIKISAPLILGGIEEINLDFQKLEKRLEEGVLLYPGSEIGERGEAIILGHSAPANWPAKDYENIFSNLDQLEKGDKIFIYYEGKKYIYEVFEKKIFFPKDEEKILKIRNQKDSILILLTCWPPGKSIQRLAILTKLLK